MISDSSCQKVTIVSLNQEKPNTCGSCAHTDNDLGIVALHCQIIYDEALADPDPNSLENYDFAKVRSWDKCHFKPSKYLSSNESVTEVEA
jgi:hypothetical protein